MRTIAFFILMIGLGLAGSAAYYANDFLGRQATLAQPEAQTVKLLAARRTLEPGTPLDAKQLRWVEWPAWSVPPGAFTSAKALLGNGNGGGEDKRYVVKTIEPGEPIVESRLSSPGDPDWLHGIIPPNMRAVSIKINAVTSVSGFVSAGDHVDIMMIRQTEDRLVNKVILQNVLILAIDQSAYAEATSPRLGSTATVAVETADAQKLALAQQIGKLSLLLRGGGETGDVEIAPMTDEVLDFLAEPVAPPGKSVTVRRGNETEVVPVD